MSKLAEKVRIANLIQKVVTEDLELGVITYQPGWSDGRVASETGAALQQVVAIRKALYGSHFATPRSSPTARFEARLEQLEKRVEELERSLDNARKTPSAPFVGAPSIIPRWDQQQ